MGTALWAAAGGAALVAQAADDPSAFAPYAAGGGTAVAVSAIVWIVKKFFSGDVVARPVAEYSRELGVLIAAMGEREARLQSALEAAHRREDELREALTDANRSMWLVNQRLGGEEHRQEPQKRGGRRQT